MARRILGLEIGNSNIKMIECKRKGSQLIIEKSKIIQTPPEAISDGVIMDTNKIYKVLYEEIKSKRYRAKNLAMVIKSSEIITRDIRMDKMPAKDMKAILELQYHDYLLVDISKYQVTYKVVGEIEKEDYTEQEILIVAAPNKMLDPLVEIADQLKMKIKSINIGSDAVSNLFKEDSFVLNMTEQEAIVIDIGGASTTVTIVSGGVGVLNKNIRFGLKEIDAKISRQFGSRQIGDMEAFKEKHGGIYGDDYEMDIYSQFISASVKPMLEHKLVPDIRRLLQFYFSRGKYDQIEKAYIIGGGASIKNIDKYLSGLIGIPCVAGIDLDFTHLSCGEEVERKSEYFGNLLGLISGL